MQNAGDTSADMICRFYDSSGAEVAVLTQSNVPAGYHWSIYLGNVSLPDGFTGSAVVNSNSPLAGMGNATCTANCAGDVVYAYNGVNRSF